MFGTAGRAVVLVLALMVIGWALHARSRGVPQPGRYYLWLVLSAGLTGLAALLGLIGDLT